jgi:hypothetical protein
MVWSSVKQWKDFVITKCLVRIARILTLLRQERFVFSYKISRNKFVGYRKLLAEKIYVKERYFKRFKISEKKFTAAGGRYIETCTEMFPQFYFTFLYFQKTIFGTPPIRTYRKVNNALKTSSYCRRNIRYYFQKITCSA